MTTEAITSNEDKDYLKKIMETLTSRTQAI